MLTLLRWGLLLFTLALGARIVLVGRSWKSILLFFVCGALWLFWERSKLLKLDAPRPR